ncbi:MAG: hypothetical protein A2172_00805 [Candidatus Woykebacteria bacterium RBG_13_40_15]|uniref:Uncharacterized protein n=1 Tax=Candidatus Woykebacteria bacterium RBG_13_40_15 TaxID=1802593 RepID=A0A1G1W942_9BACT|nr:MAG: hypothetical protein A2172_00805 [Candidatus Woykebacteria bacterium RBG_13_40_15]
MTMMNDTDFQEEEEEQAATSGVRVTDRTWLQDEDYAGGRRFPFSSEWALLQAITTRIIDRLLEFFSQKGIRIYVPVWMWRTTKPQDLESLYKRLDLEWSPKKGKKAHVLLDDKGNIYRMVKGEPMFLGHLPEGMRGAFATHQERWGEHYEKRLQSGEEGSRERKAYRKFHTFSLGDETYKFLGEIQRVRYWVLTPIIEEAYSQSPRQPFHMVPKARLEKRYNEELERRWKLIEDYRRDPASVERRPKEKTYVPYCYRGYANPVTGDSLDFDLLRALRDPSLIKERYDPETEDVPPPLPFMKIGGKLCVPGWLETEGALYYRVHLEVALEFVTARQVYEGLQKIKEQERTKFQESGAGPEADFDALEVDPVRAALSCLPVQGGFENLLNEEYDWMNLTELNQLRKIWQSVWNIQAVTWEQKADKLWTLVGFYFHLIEPPVLTPDGLNWEAMKMFAAPFEVLRDIVRIIRAWQMARSMRTKRGQGGLTEAVNAQACDNDAGGPRPPLEWKYNDRFMRLYKLAEEVSGRSQEERLEYLGPRWLAGWKEGHDNRAPTEEETIQAVRERILGPYWMMKDPFEERDHGNSLAREIFDAHLAFQSGLEMIWSYCGQAIWGVLPPRGATGVDRDLAKVMNYPNEFLWALQKIDLATDDPKWLWETYDGIVFMSLVDKTNQRFRSPMAFGSEENVRFSRWTSNDPARPSYTQFGNMLLLMWNRQPLAPKQALIDRQAQENEDMGETDLRKGYRADLAGQPWLEGDGRPDWRNFAAKRLEVADDFADAVLIELANGNDGELKQASLPMALRLLEGAYRRGLSIHDPKVQQAKRFHVIRLPKQSASFLAQSRLAKVLGFNYYQQSPEKAQGLIAGKIMDGTFEEWEDIQTVAKEVVQPLLGAAALNFGRTSPEKVLLDIEGRWTNEEIKIVGGTIPYLLEQGQYYGRKWVPRGNGSPLVVPAV